MVQTVRADAVSMTCRAHFPRFEVHAQRCPQVLAKIIGLLAAQNLQPAEMHFRQSAAGLWMAMELDVEPAQAERLAEKLRSFVTVEAVILVPAFEPGMSAGEVASLPSPRAENVPRTFSVSW